MAGNKKGGAKAAETIRRLYGDDFWSKVGKKGGNKTGVSWLTGNSELAAKIGRMGKGKKHHRRKSMVREANSDEQVKEG